MFDNLFKNHISVFLLGSGPGADDVETAIQAWYDEISDYNYGAQPQDQCDPGKKCGHYTQVRNNTLK